MIELRTGVPGSGKTLSMVEALAKILASWEKKPELARPIFVHNIKNLALAHSPMPLLEIPAGTKTWLAPDLEKNGHGANRLAAGTRTFIVPDWDAMPDGSLVIIDECQDVLPPRSSQSAAPPHIAFLNTHRHRGFDIWLTTQHPKLIDFSARALVGKHMHYRRLFGGQRAAVYEWDGCSDSLGGMKDSVMSFYSFPKKAFQYYKSAEVHTKQSFKLPRWLLVPLAGLLLGVFAIPKAYTTLSGAVSGKGLGGSAEQHRQEFAAATPKAVSASEPVRGALPPALPASAPAAPVPVAAGCIAQADRCKCFDGAGSPVPVQAEMCEALNEPKRPAPLAGALFDAATPGESTQEADLETWRFMSNRRRS